MARAAFANALAFLSRFSLPGSPKLMAHSCSLEQALPWFGPVGLVLGCIWTLAALLVPLAASSATEAPLWAKAGLAGWIWLLLSVWTTLGLHWDGLADMGDAEGSRASGERFRQILADSRLGAFGVLRLCLVLGGQCLAVAWHSALIFQAQGLASEVRLALALALAPAWGRGVAVLLAHAAFAKDPDSLGGRACAAARPCLLVAYSAGAVAVVALLIFLGLPFVQALLLAAVQALLLRRLVVLARREGGLSGDFFGAAIEEATLCFLLFTL